MKNKKIATYIIIVVVAIIIIGVFTKVKDNNSQNKEISIIISNQDITSELQNKILIEDDTVYMSIDDVKKCFDENIYYEEESGFIITTSEKKLAALKIDESDIEINGSEVTIDGQALKTNEKIYIPISELENVYDYQFDFIKKSNIITIDYYSKKMEKAKAKKNISLRKEKSGISSKVEKIKKDDWVIVIDKEDKWTKVRSQDGNIGYLKNSKLTDFTVERDDMEISSDSKNDKIFEKDISSKKINLYDNRKKVINEILGEMVSKNYKNLKIVYKADSNNKNYKRFIIEITPVLRECGMKLIIDK